VIGIGILAGEHDRTGGTQMREDAAQLENWRFEAIGDKAPFIQA
jgi:hypothetical protein